MCANVSLIGIPYKQTMHFTMKGKIDTYYNYIKVHFKLHRLLVSFLIHYLSYARSLYHLEDVMKSPLISQKWFLNKRFKYFMRSDALLLGKGQRNVSILPEEEQ